MASSFSFGHVPLSTFPSITAPTSTLRLVSAARFSLLSAA